jgi:hypothetical protein
METIYNYDWADKNAKLQVCVCVCVCVCARVSPSLLLTTSAPFCFCSLCPLQGSFCLPIQSEYGARYDRFIVKKIKPGDEVGINMLKKHRSVRIDYLRKNC